jgi:hypothetical protein
MQYIKKQTQIQKNNWENQLNNIHLINDIAHVATEVLESEMQNRYFSRY